MKTKFLDSWMVKKAEYIIKNPIHFCLITGINLYFYFRYFGTKTNLLFLYIWTVVTCIILVLIKYKVIKLEVAFKEITNKEIANSLRLLVSFVAFFILLGIIFGIYLLLTQTLASFFFMFLNLLDALKDFLFPNFVS